MVLFNAQQNPIILIEWSDNQSGRITEGRISEVLLYMYLLWKFLFIHIRLINSLKLFLVSCVFISLSLPAARQWTRLYAMTMK